MLLEALAVLARRWPGSRFVASAAHRFGALATVRRGRISTGSTLYLNLKEWQQRRLFFYGEIEPETTAFLRRTLKPGDAFFDVGANAGYFAFLAADLGARSYAFEPAPRPYELLARSASEDDRVEAEAIACGDREGELLLYISPDPHNSGMSSLVKPELGRAITVKVTRLDAMRVMPAVVKIDVEGAELSVVRGAQRLLNDHRPIVVVETSDSVVDELVSLMAAHGYSAHSLRADGSLAPFLALRASPENLVFVYTA